MYPLKTVASYIPHIDTRFRTPSIFLDVISPTESRVMTLHIASFLMPPSKPSSKSFYKTFISQYSRIFFTNHICRVSSLN